MRDVYLPGIVYRYCVLGAYIVGSQAKYIAGDIEEPEGSDWDLLVPYDKWQIIAMMLPSNAGINKFGGIRFEADGVEIDIWPSSVEKYLKECKTKHADGNVRVVDFINNIIFTSSRK